MATACYFHGILGVRNGRSYQYSAGKSYWKHDGYLPLAFGDLEVEFFTFGGDGAPLPEGIYSGVARVVERTTVSGAEPQTEPVLQLFANEDFFPVPPLASTDERMPPPVFVIAGKVSRTIQSEKAFDMDVSQWGAGPQQLVRLRCFYPSTTARLAKTPLPSAAKHVLVHGSLTGFVGGRCCIRVLDIAFGPSGSLLAPGANEPSPPTKMKSYDWSGRSGKRVKREDEDPDASGSGSQSTTA